ncbi:phosphate acyltransferase PlsX [Mycoplasmatota bacterium WC44]
MIKIAVDAMGGDNAPEITVLGAMNAIKNFSDIEINLYGNKYEIHKYLTNTERINVIHTLEHITMDEKEAIKKMRRDKKSSMAMAMYSVKEGVNDAFVTAGPTGPFVAGAHLIVRRIDGMKRTALTPIFPKLDGLVALLDVGANIEIKPDHLLQYANSASIYAKEVLGIDNPKVGLLNNGEEKGKGRDIERAAYDLMDNDPNINFIGNVESKFLFTTEADVLVTDGFTGNAILKSTEGALKAFSTVLKREIASNTTGKIGYLFMKKNLKSVANTFDVSDVGGAILLGVNAPCIKAHGSSDARDYASAIKQARNVVDKDVINKIKNVLKVE